MSTPEMDVPAVTGKASAKAPLRPPYQWALLMHGFENAGSAEGAIDQSRDK